MENSSPGLLGSGGKEVIHATKVERIQDPGGQGDKYLESFALLPSVSAAPKQGEAKEQGHMSGAVSICQPPGADQGREGVATEYVKKLINRHFN